MKCLHENIEVHDCRPLNLGIGIRCVECHAVMTHNANGEAWHNKHRGKLIPVDRKYFKAFVAPPQPSRLDGYNNWQMVRD